MVQIDPAQLRALTSVVSEGTFDAAARRLHVTPSAVSQRIKALETSVGRVLVTRTKPVQPTAAGEALLRLARQVDLLTDDLARELGDEGASTVLPLAVNADSLATWVLPALARVEAPVVFDLHRVDEARTADLLRAGTVMAAVTSAADPVPGCSVVRLGRMRYRARASAAFVERWFGDGVTPASSGSCADGGLRPRRQDAGPLPATPFAQAVGPAPAPCACVERLPRRCRIGLGWGMVPDLQASGDMVELDPRGVIDVHLYWQQWRLRSASLDQVASAVRASAAEALD